MPVHFIALAFLLFYGACLNAVHPIYYGFGMTKTWSG